MKYNFPLISLFKFNYFNFEINLLKFTRNKKDRGIVILTS